MATFDKQPLSNGPTWRGIPDFSITKEDGTMFIFDEPSLLRVQAGSYGISRQIEFPVQWLLTEVRSVDHVDNAPIGVGDEDLGSWIKIEHSRVANRVDYGNAAERGVGPNDIR